MTSRDLRTIAADIFTHGIAAVDPYRCVLSDVSIAGPVLKVAAKEYDLGRFHRLLVIGAGKASVPMARAAEDTLGARIASGLVITKYGHAEPLTRIQVREAGHPLPDASGVSASEELLGLVSGLNGKTLVFCLISGGGSALLVSPAEGLTLGDKTQTTRLLLGCGANIHEVNTVRKHLSRVKGGMLASTTAPARVITLILSDVIGDPLEVIASGPTAPDPTTFSDALAVLARYHLLRTVPERVRTHLEKGAAGNRAETPKPGNSVFNAVQHQIVGNNLRALAAARERAEQLGFKTIITTAGLQGEARESARIFGSTARDIRETSRPIAPPACVLAGGETTVTVQGNGLGGRNQEMALAAAFEIQGLRDMVFLSAGTDGTDGPTDAAGAFADGATLSRASLLGMDARDSLDRNDSYHFFKSLGDLHITGPTKTNVMDMQILLIDR